MTTPTTPAERPERMTDAELHELESTPPTSLYAAQSEIEVLLEEIRAGREEEARLERKRATEEKFGFAMTREFAHAVVRLVGYRTAAIRLAATFEALAQVPYGFAFDLGREGPSIRRAVCIYCGETTEPEATQEAEFGRWRQHALTCPKHPMRKVEAERDAATNAAVETGALLESATAALRGEPVSDFMESFQPVAEAVEARARIADLTDVLKSAEDDRDAAREDAERLRPLIVRLRARVLAAASHVKPKTEGRRKLDEAIAVLEEIGNV